MKNNRMILYLLVVLLACMPGFRALAAADAADKTVVETEDGSRKYRITVTVPGEDKENRYDEILIMVDGSYSLDQEWPYAKAGILEIGGMVLNGKNNVRLTLMAFGMAPNVVAEHIETMDQLEALLDTYQGNLLYGRSSTNIEGAFIGIQRYLASHAASMEDAVVVFMTDGGVNQYAYPNKWLTEVAARYANHQNLAAALFSELSYAFYGEASLSPETRQVFTEEEINTMLAAVPEKEKAVIQKIAEKPYDETITKGKKWLETILENIYAYNNMSDENGGYSICDMERATLDYQASIGAYIENAFYYIAGSANITGGETVNQQRAIDVAHEIATNEAYRLEKMYLVQYASDSRAEWMQFKTGTAQYKEMPDNVEYVHAGAMSNLVATIQKMLSEISLTPYNNVTIVDYMSKWVELLPETICVLDQDDQVVAEYDAEHSDPANNNYQYKWLVDPPLCDDLPPLEVADVPESEYEMGGADVSGNTNGVIKKITWNVKQGPLMRIDHYRMEYDILVDVNEAGFRYSLSYPTNGYTYVNYTDENNQRRSSQIPVPKVKLLLPASPTPVPAPPAIPTPPPADIPETGDGAHPIFWMMALLLSGGALGLALRKKAK